MSTKNPFAPKGKTPASTPQNDNANASAVVVVPPGTAKETREWVGEDVDRAQAALDAETGPAGGKRKTLITALEDILAGD